MSIELRSLSRIELIKRRRDDGMEAGIQQTRALAWGTLIRGAAALAREYAQEDKELARYFTEMAAKAAARKKECVASYERMNREIERITELLRAGDTLENLKDEAGI